MVKADITTKHGAKITIDGTQAEVRDILEQLGYASQHPTQQHGSANRRIAVAPDSLLGQLVQLKEEKFFDQPRGISEVKAALDQKAHSYPIQSISTALIRAVQKGIFGRVPGTSGWQYVKGDKHEWRGNYKASGRTRTKDCRVGKIRGR